MKRFGCLALLVVLFLGGWGIYRAANMARVGGVAFSKLPPQAQKQRRVEAQQLVQNIETIAREARESSKSGTQNSPKTFEVKASEAQLNTLLQDRLRTEKFPISDLRIGLSRGLVIVQGTVKYGGVEWPATISGALDAKNGALRYQIESLSVTGLPAPPKLRDKAQKAIENGLQKALANKNRANFDSVEIAPGELTVRGQTGGNAD